jgi:penicillin amidase
VLRAQLANKLTPQQIADMWPGARRESVDAGLLRGLPWSAIADVAWPAEAPRGASNSWVFAGQRTASGKPILANDPHLGFSAPIVWYLAHLEAPGLSVSGATVPGVPITVLGHNRRIAWGITSTHGDLEDLIVETIDPADPGRYLTPDGPRPFETRIETIRVKDSDDVTLTYRSTRHGPVISDFSARAAAGSETGKVLSLAATFLRDDDLTPQALYRINRADGLPAFRIALDDFHAPQQNFVFADVDGNIGFMAAGRVPVRRSGDGWFPSSGASGDGDWTGFVPYLALPQVFNPDDGAIINANHRIVERGFPFFISHDWAAGYRNQRLHEMLDGENRLDVDKAGAAQLDIVSLVAREVLPLMLDAPAETDAAKMALDLLRKWDGSMGRNRPEPLIFTAWFRALGGALYGDELGESLAHFRGLRARFVASILRRKHQWCDDVNTKAVAESCPDQLFTSLEAALKELSAAYGDDIAAWKWGEAHQAQFRHAVLSGVPGANLLADLGIAMDGGSYTVNRGSIAGVGDRPYSHVHGSGYRAVYDLADLARSRFVIATGQSGNPLSIHYRDLMEDWRDGRSMRLDQPRDDVSGASLGTLVLQPGSSAAR